MLDSYLSSHREDILPHGLYIHIPFCRSKCDYCAFYSIAGTNLPIERFFKGLHKEISFYSQRSSMANREFATIFFGGGTPTMLSPSSLVELLQLSRNIFDVDDNPEVSIEVNPATVDYNGLLTLRRGGFNRISIGVQSLNDEELRLLGRPHCVAEAEKTMRSARRAGFHNVSIDLMYGLPGQTPSQWRETLLRGLEMEPQHLSIYELTPEEGTPLARRLAEDVCHLPHEDEVLEMMDITVRECTAMGILRYEISNYALPGFECEHNRNYWRAYPYLGLGPGAVSRLNIRRAANVADVNAYCESIEQAGVVPVEEEVLDDETWFREAVIMGLRMLDGVSISELHHRFGINALTYYGEILSKLINDKFLVIDGDHLHLSPLGLPIANSIMARLV
ncbi:MAG: radical SAM family heme chaperone HemW [Desulfobulbaceae bacterium]|nr:radical SAM family heme chaperone HemW [Desulfobulbaceae bacterium]